jgi:CRP-like cAMP-binding protein
MNPNGQPTSLKRAGETGTTDHHCPAFAFNMCCALKPEMDGVTAVDPRAQDVEVPARRTIWRERESVAGVPLICRGWAAATASTSDGRRQILSFLLPGEPVSAVLVSEPVIKYAVEAITDVRYRLFRRADVRAALARDPAMIAALSRQWSEESARAVQLALDLGQRSAPERIARLILNLADRLARRGLMRERTLDFPLRHRHIADATGLTPVHAGKVLTEFRRAGLLEITDRSLTLSNPNELCRIALL